MIRLASLTVAATVLFASASVLAQSDDPASKSAARQLSIDGVKAFEDGKYEDALDKLDRGWSLVRAPTLGLWSARAMVKLGKLVAAAERYHETSRVVLGADAGASLQQAKSDAAKEREALLPRIPQIEISIAGGATRDVAVSIDSREIPSALVGVKRPIDPGKHTIAGKRGAEVVEETVTVAEGQVVPVTLTFTGVPASPASTTEPRPRAPPAVAPVASTGAPPEQDSPSSGSTQRTLGWISLGVGGAGLVVGGIFGATALSLKSKLDDDCVDRECGPDSHDDVKDYDNARTFTTIGLVVGGVGVVGGLTLLLTAPSSGASAARAPYVAGWMGPTSAGVSGRF